jgi:hypothetical protein
MKNFAQVRQSMGLTGGTTTTTSNTTPNLTYRYNAPGPGIQESIVIELNQGPHVTIYQNSWDGVVAIMDLGGSPTSVGPHCLHMTAGASRWFYNVQSGGTLAPVTDYGDTSERALKSIKTFMEIIGTHLK